MSNKFLILMRHAQAVSYSRNGDYHRELTRAGIEQAQWVGKAIASYLPSVDTVYCSDAVRAQQTLLNASKHLSVQSTVFDKEIYTIGTEDLVSLVCQCDGNICLIVGHEPIISEAAAFLTDSLEELRQELLGGVPTATAIILTFNGEWKSLTKGLCKIVHVIYAPIF